MEYYRVVKMNKLQLDTQKNPKNIMVSKVIKSEKVHAVLLQKQTKLNKTILGYIQKS